MNPGWSYILTTIGVFGLWLAGRKDWRARAWDEGVDFVTRHPGMSAEYVRAANPYRQTEGNRA